MPDIRTVKDEVNQELKDYADGQGIDYNGLRSEQIAEGINPAWTGSGPRGSLVMCGHRDFRATQVVDIVGDDEKFCDTHMQGVLDHVRANSPEHATLHTLDVTDTFQRAGQRYQARITWSWIYIN